MAMNVPDQVKRETMAIMKHKIFCAFSGVIACGKVIYSTSVPTACTNGWDTTYNEKFIREHADTPKKLRFLILHEAVHKAYRHMHVWRELWKEDSYLANTAADHMVNLSLILADPDAQFIQMLDVGVKPEQRFKGWSVVQIFRALQKEQEKKPEGQGEEKPEDGSGQDGEGFDLHDWEGAGKEAAEEVQKKADEIGRAIRQGEMMSQKLRSRDGTGNSEGVFGDLLNGKVDWKKALRDFVSEYCAGRDDSSWRKVNRRMIGDGILMPGSVGLTLKELCIGFDTSGSCFNSTEMTRFVTEITMIVEQVKPSRISVIYWDTKVVAHQTFEDGQFAVAALKPQGGGGTDGSVLFDYLRSKRIKPDAIVQFTDGYVGDWGKTDVPTLWAVTGRGITAPFGTTIQIEV